GPGVHLCAPEFDEQLRAVGGVGIAEVECRQPPLEEPRGPVPGQSPPRTPARGGGPRSPRSTAVSACSKSRPAASQASARSAASPARVKYATALAGSPPTAASKKWGRNSSR